MARDIEVIRRDIEETRGRLRDTAEAIGWKADVPARARDMVRETAGVIRERVAAGSHPRNEGNGRTGDVASQTGSGAGSVKETVGGGVATVKETVGHGTESVAGALDAGASAAHGAVSRGIGEAASAIGKTREAVAAKLPSADQAGDSARLMVSGARSNALGITVAALVVGVAAGIMLPVTRIENEQLGPVADELRERGTELGETAIARGRGAAEQVASAVSES